MLAAWVFGSRATGRARRYSDLDLAVDAGRPLTLDETARLSEAFRESDLPYRVDLADWQSIGDRFRQTIAADRTPLAEEAGHGGEDLTPPAVRPRIGLIEGSRPGLQFSRHGGSRQVRGRPSVAAGSIGGTSSRGLLGRPGYIRGGALLPTPG